MDKRASRRTLHLTMNRFVVFALLANTWAQAQRIYLPDSPAGVRPSTLAHAQDGVFTCDLAAGARARVEDREVVVRFPLVSTPAPRAKGIVLVDSSADSQFCRRLDG